MNPLHPAGHRFGSGRRRRGIGSLEVMVACSLLAAAMAIVIPLFVHHQRLLAASCRERLAIEELANLAEHLAAHAPSWQQTIETLALSDLAHRRLPDARLEVEQGPTSLGTRAILSLSWNDPGRQAHPLRLAVWAPPGSEEEP
jgi:hypothetical protein